MDYQRERKRSSIPKVIGCILLVLILLGGCSGLAWWGGHALWQKLLLTAGFQPGEFEQIMADTSTKRKAPAGVYVGKRWHWRELLSDRLGLIGNIVAGDFDGDGEREVVFVNGFGDNTPRLFSKASWLFEVDGAKQQVGLEFTGFISDAVAWDVDGDGRDEIVTDLTLSSYYDWLHQPVPAQYRGINTSLVVPVFALSGNIVELLDGASTWRRPLVGDFSGGGQPELMLQYVTQGGPNKLLYYGPGPVKLASQPCPAPPFPEFAADVNADGRDEVISQDMQDESIYYFRYDEDRSSLTDWAPDGPLLGAADINGDGVAELFMKREYYDPAADAVTPYQFPSQAYQAQDPQWGIRLADTDGDGTVEIILLSGENFYYTGFYVFKRDGSCIYYEEFGQVMHDLVVVHAAGHDHLAALLDTRLLIYP